MSFRRDFSRPKSNYRPPPEGPFPLVSDAQIKYILQFVGCEVTVGTKWMSEYVGILVGFDNKMNLVLKDAKESRKRRDEPLHLAGG